MRATILTLTFCLSAFFAVAQTSPNPFEMLGKTPDEITTLFGSRFDKSDKVFDESGNYYFRYDFWNHKFGNYFFFFKNGVVYRFHCGMAFNKETSQEDILNGTFLNWKKHLPDNTMTTTGKYDSGGIITFTSKNLIITYNPEKKYAGKITLKFDQLQ